MAFQFTWIENCTSSSTNIDANNDSGRIWAGRFSFALPHFYSLLGTTRNLQKVRRGARVDARGVWAMATTIGTCTNHQVHRGVPVRIAAAALLLGDGHYLCGFSLPMLTYCIVDKFDEARFTTEPHEGAL